MKIMKILFALLSLCVVALGLTLREHSEEQMLAETKMDRSLLDYVIDGITGETKTDVIRLA